MTTKLRPLPVLAVVGGLLLCPAPGRAQIMPAGDSSPDEEMTADSTSSEPVTPIAAAPDLGAPADNVREPSADESVYVVQHRAYSKSGKFEVSALMFTSINPKFVGYIGAAVSVSYHIQENLALELFSAAHPVGAFYSDLVYEVWKYEDLTPEEVDLKQILYYNSLSLMFSALYGKLEFYGFLVDYDFFVTGGIGYALTREPCTPGVGDCTDQAVDIGRGLQIPDRGLDAHKITGNLGVGMRVFFHEMIGARLEFRNIVFADRKVETGTAGRIGDTTTDIRNTMMLILGASLLFG